MLPAAWSCREETQAIQEEQMYHKMHKKQLEAQQDNAWMYSVPEWHNAELAGQNKPWTVPSQLLTAEEEVSQASLTCQKDVWDVLVLLLVHKSSTAPNRLVSLACKLQPTAIKIMTGAFAALQLQC